MLKRNPAQKAKDIQKYNAWKQRTSEKAMAKREPRTQIKSRSTKRAKQERSYLGSHSAFLTAHPICPVTGGTTTQVHHSARRVGEWLNLQRYWIAVSAQGHEWIEKNGKEAEKLGLMVKIYKTYQEHVQDLAAIDVSLTSPVFYDLWDGVPLLKILNKEKA